VKRHVLIVILAGIGLVIGLNALPTTTGGGSALERLTEEVRNTLVPEDAARLDRLLQQDEKAWAELSVFWEEQQNPLIAGIYAYREARRRETRDAWLRAGKLGINAFTFIEKTGTHQDMFDYFLEIAYQSFDKVLQEDPANPDAQTGIATCLVNGKGPAMQGIQTLLAVVEEYPTNIEALLQLGDFSLMSGQYNKAIERYQKVLEVDSLNSRAMTGMGKALMDTGDTAGATDYLLQALTLEKVRYRKNEILQLLK